MSQTEVIAALSVKREPAFTEEHERAVAAACEKLWNGEPVDDPIHSPRHPRHPLCVVGNAAHDGLNAALAMRTQLLHAWREIDTLRAQLTPGDPRVTTHHADCWQTRGHHACAIRLVLALQGSEARLKETLEFYANEANWRSPSTGFALQYDPEPSPINKDRGQRARAASSTTPTA